MNNECKLRPLKYSEVKGENRLEVIERRGAIAELTEFARLLGGRMMDNRYSHRLEYIGTYCTETVNKKNNKVLAIGTPGYGEVLDDWEVAEVNRDDSEIGIRLTMPLEEWMLTTGKLPIRAEDGVLEKEMGWLPKDVLGYVAYKDRYKEIEQLKKAERRGKIKETPYEYTTDFRQTAKANGSQFISSPKKVFEYKGKFYIKQNPVKSDCNQNEEYFVEIMPVKWLVDEKNRRLVMKDIVWANVKYDDLEKFVKEIMYNEIFQIREIDEIDIRQKYEPGFWHNLFHKRDKVKALPKSTQEGKQEKLSNEQEIKSKLKMEEPQTNKFIENLRKVEKNHSPNIGDVLNRTMDGLGSQIRSDIIRSKRIKQDDNIDR